MARISVLARVSSAKASQDESPERQVEEGRAWALRNGFEVADEIRERVSGSKGLGARPGLDRALAQIRKGTSSGIWVSRLDRLGRDLIKITIAMREIEGAGGRVYIADLFGGMPYDSKNPWAVYMMNSLLGAAQFQRDLLGKAAIEGKERAREKHGDAYVTRPTEDISHAEGVWLAGWFASHPGEPWYRATRDFAAAGFRMAARLVKRSGTWRPARPWSQCSLRRAFGRWRKKVDEGERRMKEGEEDGKNQTR